MNTWRTGEEHIHPVVACEREDALDELRRIWDSRGLGDDRELQEATVAFAYAYGRSLAGRAVARLMYGDETTYDPYCAPEPTRGADHAA